MGLVCGIGISRFPTLVMGCDGQPYARPFGCGPLARVWSIGAVIRAMVDMCAGRNGWPITGGLIIQKFGRSRVGASECFPSPSAKAKAPP